MNEIEITWREIEIIIQMWRDRATEQGYKPGTKTYARYEIEFFVGVMAMLTASHRKFPSIWTEIILSGRSLADTLIRPSTIKSQDSNDEIH